MESNPLDDELLLKASRIFDSHGGRLSAAGTSLVLDVPPGAISHGQMQEIYFKIFVHRPYDWQKLKKNKTSVDIPIFDLGPPGLKFAVPLRITFDIDPDQNVSDTGFQFCNGEYSKDAVWADATRAESEEDARKQAALSEPYVSYFVDRGKVIAYYKHFTGGRIVKSSCEKVMIEATVYGKQQTHAGICLSLQVIFCKDKDESIAVSVVKYYDSLNLHQKQHEDY